MSSAPWVAGGLFFLILVAWLSTEFDKDLCPGVVEWHNETTNSSQITTDWIDYVWNSKCQELPGWYKIIIYTPFIAMVIRGVIATN